MKEKLLLTVQEKSFLVHDLLLYLDTHPEDEDALRAYRRALRDRNAAVRNYEQQIGSLQADSDRMQSDFDWLDGEFPWQ